MDNKESKEKVKLLNYLGDIKISSILLLLSTFIFSTLFVIMVSALCTREYFVGIPAIILLIIFGCLGIALMSILGVKTFKMEEESNYSFKLDKTYIEVRIGIILLVLIFLLTGIKNTGLWYIWQDYLYFSSGYNISFAEIIYYGIRYIIYDVIFVATYVICGLSIIRSIKHKQIKSCTEKPIIKFIEDIKSFFNESRYKNHKFKEKLHKRQRNYLICMVVLGVLAGYCGFFSFDLVGLGFLLGVSMLVISIIFVLREDKMTKDIDKIISQIDEISKGNLHTFNTLDEKSLLYLTGKELNEIQQGFQKSVEQKIKSERMKIELVTNVSHDLKTPLTSIISYIELLDKEELSPECRDYVNVLKNKSNRLKNMVADLFTLAKVTSGEQSLELMELDFTKLVQQTLGDMEDVIEKSSLILRTNITEEETKVLGDGNKLYRSIQNILDNAFKYGLSGTRIFLDVVKEDGYVKLTLKNTSDIEITYTAEEIIERFFRGDEARTTEGNGLGLSIAKGFVEYIGGSFDIVLDGDQFKVIIKIPLIDSNKQENAEKENSVDNKGVIIDAVENEQEMTLIEKVNKIEDDKLRNKSKWNTLKK